MKDFQLEPYRVARIKVEQDHSAIHTVSVGNSAQVLVEFDRSLAPYESDAITREFERLAATGGQISELRLINNRMRFSTKDDEVPAEILEFIVDNSERLAEGTTREFNKAASILQNLESGLQQFVAS